MQSTGRDGTRWKLRSWNHKAFRNKPVVCVRAAQWKWTHEVWLAEFSIHCQEGGHVWLDAFGLSLLELSKGSAV